MASSSKMQENQQRRISQIKTIEAETKSNKNLPSKQQASKSCFKKSKYSSLRRIEWLKNMQNSQF